VGCGPVQEHFLGCSDISIGDVHLVEETETETETTTAAAATTVKPTTPIHSVIEIDSDDHYQEQPTVGSEDEETAAITATTTTLAAAATAAGTTADELVEIVAILEAANPKNETNALIDEGELAEVDDASDSSISNSVANGETSDSSSSSTPLPIVDEETSDSTSSTTPLSDEETSESSTSSSVPPVVNEETTDSSSTSAPPSVLNSEETDDSSITSEPPLIVNEETSDSSSVSPPVANENAFEFNGCKSRLEFGSTINISRMISIYCYRMCKVKCPVLIASELSVDQMNGKEYEACTQTCPLLCLCK
jgi:hypothetical protein